MVDYAPPKPVPALVEEAPQRSPLPLPPGLTFDAESMRMLGYPVDREDLQRTNAPFGASDSAKAGTDTEHTPAPRADAPSLSALFVSSAEQRADNPYAPPVRLDAARLNTLQAGTPAEIVVHGVLCRDQFPNLSRDEALELARILTPIAQSHGDPQLQYGALLALSHLEFSVDGNVTKLQHRFNQLEKDSSVRPKEMEQAYHEIGRTLRHVPDPSEFERMRERAAAYRPSSFVSGILAINERVGADPDTIERARVELGCIVENVREKLLMSKAKDPESVLHTIADEVHNRFTYSYKLQGNFAEGMSTHQLDCDTVGIIYKEIGKQLNLPIELRMFRAVPVSHVVASWERPLRSPILWETVNGEPEERKYKDEKEIWSGLVRSGVAPMNSRSIVLSDNAMLAHQLLENEVRTVRTAIGLLRNEHGDEPVSRQETRAQVDKVLHDVIKLDPNNALAQFLLGRRDVAIRAAASEGARFKRSFTCWIECFDKDLSLAETQERIRKL